MGLVKRMSVESDSNISVISEECKQVLYSQDRILSFGDKNIMMNNINEISIELKYLVDNNFIRVGEPKYKILNNNIDEMIEQVSGSDSKNNIINICNFYQTYANSKTIIIGCRGVTNGEDK